MPDWLNTCSTNQMQIKLNEKSVCGSTLHDQVSIRVFAEVRFEKFTSSKIVPKVRFAVNF